MVGVDPEHVAFAGAAQRLLDIADAVNTVGRHPGERDNRHDRPLNHLDRKRWLGRKCRARRHMAPGHPSRVAGPGLWQVKCSIDEGVTMPGDIGRKNAGLAVGDLASRAGVLTANAAGGLALLEKTSLVDDQHRIVGGERLNYIISALTSEQPV